ncbi:ATP-dependent zinc metalloprotease FTSH 7, chloroplastic-like [Silene latifolia]|uniref:ATP-dependent zinc metalloprotease FTSH 7, chloroplastic-like n=1 Tax=Silene latifolia TaxID=37657 RepID=UPI003D778A43
MESIIHKSLIYTKLNSNYYCNGPIYLRSSSNFALNYTSSQASNCFPQIRVSKFGDFMNSRNRKEQITTRTRAQENPTYPSNSSPENTDSPPPLPPEMEKREKDEEGKGQGKWRWRWQWKPLIQGEEISLLAFQLGFIMLVFRFLRLDIPIAGSEPRPLPIPVPYSEFLSKIDSNQVEKVEINGVDTLFKLRSDEKIGVSSIQDCETMSLLTGVAPLKRVVYSTTRPADIQAPYQKMFDNGVSFGSSENRFGEFLHSAVMTLFYIMIVTGVIEKIHDRFSTMTGQIKVRKSDSSDGAKDSKSGTSVTFADVAGVDEAKEELEEIVEFLRNPDKYIRLGARSPRGVLLVGLPGTGKTLLAKAVAGEAGVSFVSCSGSQFVELYSGMGASRVRDLFAEAKKIAPSIIFIDEIDAVAKIRNGRLQSSSNDERDQTLNQLLTEMDGFDSSSTVIVLGATNRVDVLDPAVLRPGRFDRVVQVETPDRIGRLAILNVHASKKNIPLTEDVDLNAIATMTTGFTGADLANLVNEAALLAGRQNKVVVEKIDFIQAFERSIAGIEKKTAKLNGIEKAVVARHEAGHAVAGTAVANLLPGQPRVQKLSILPRSGGTMGFTYTPPTDEERYLLFVDELRGRLVTLLGGRAAEEFAYAGRVLTGALDDIRRATDMAYKAIAEYGLSQTIGPVSVATLSAGGINGSGALPWARDQGHVVDLVQREVKSLLQSALDVALCVICANASVLEGLGAHLEANEKVEGEELEEWLKLVVAPTELSLFVQGKEEPFLPPQPFPENQL